MKSVQLLVISPPSIEKVNRAVYRLLVTRYNIDVHMVIPSRYWGSDAFKECASVTDEPFSATLLEPVGSNPRLLRLRGLPELVRSRRPSHVLVDADPASLLVKDALRAVRGFSAEVWTMTAENLERSYLREGFESLLHGHVSTAAGRFITWWLLWSSRNNVDHVFTISRDGTRVMSSSGFVGRVTQIPLGFDAGRFYPQSNEQITATRQRLGLHTKTIAYFGRPVPEKGVDLLILALARLKDLSWQFLVDEFSEYRLPYVSQLQNQIKALEISDRVVYFDATHSEMPDYMNAADIVVLPSVSTPKWKEQYGRVIPEAMACGKIVVGSQTGAIPEIIGDSGFLFPEGDIEALADILRYLLKAQHDELELVRAKAVERAHSDLSTLRQAEIWAKMLNQDNSNDETGISK